MRPQFEWHLEAMTKAGREVTTEGRLSPETSAILDRPLFDDSEAYAKMINEHWTSLGVERECAEAQ